ncbi:hypothetical protein pipiens_002419 [Culex pipiens pipiens]|uniref:Fibrinogen C-terminal domain-containing protein n=1 Tax=Culex pipiens pipiens TaxID=38569 RepID=A0ABD1DIH3_CULPP
MGEECMKGNEDEGIFQLADRDNDKWRGGNCAQKYGGGWWFFECRHTSLNGPFEKDEQHWTRNVLVEDGPMLPRTAGC